MGVGLAPVPATLLPHVPVQPPQQEIVLSTGWALGCSLQEATTGTGEDKTKVDLTTWSTSVTLPLRSSDELLIKTVIIDSYQYRRSVLNGGWVRTHTLLIYYI